MSITIDAIYENGVLRPVLPLPLSEHAHVRVTVEEQVKTETPVPEAGDEAGTPTLGDQIAALVAALPPEVVESWPADGAAQHDHYLYGSPKRPEPA